MHSELNAIGDSFYGTPAICGDNSYMNPVHQTMYTAMHTIRLGVPGKQEQMVCRADGASRSVTGAVERFYGWMTVNPPPLPVYCCYSMQHFYDEWFWVLP